MTTGSFLLHQRPFKNSVVIIFLYTVLSSTFLSSHGRVRSELERVSAPTSKTRNPSNVSVELTIEHVPGKPNLSVSAPVPVSPFTVLRNNDTPVVVTSQEFSNELMKDDDVPGSTTELQELLQTSSTHLVLRLAQCRANCLDKVEKIFSV